MNKAVTVLHCDRFCIIIANCPSPHSDRHSALSLAQHHILASLVKGEVLSPEKIRATTGGIAFHQHNYFNRHNLNRHFGAKRRSQHFAMTATYQIITLYNSAVLQTVANLRHFQRRNLVRHIAAGGIYGGFQPP